MPCPVLLFGFRASKLRVFIPLAPSWRLGDRGDLSRRPMWGGEHLPALAGWDAVTGVGTPNFEALKAAALQLP